jgi:hypothetical protein
MIGNGKVAIETDDDLSFFGRKSFHAEYEDAFILCSHLKKGISYFCSIIT